ncbi:MAG TPA: glycine oxidase ThiO [Dehalococcoidia bacterium]|nr:glycine oxidase ThiO [Dehalococcoidia bacterium]
MDQPVGGSVPAHADVVVVGAGVIGLATAWRAAQSGLTVVAVDPAPGDGASRVAAGMLAPVSEAQVGEPEVLRLSLESLRRYPAFVAELEAESGRSTGFVQCGSLFVARDADDLAALDRELRFRERIGLSVQRLNAAECRALEPALAPGVRGGMLADGDHQIDPRRLVAALLEACVRRGVDVVPAQAELLVERSAVRGVRAAGATIVAGAVVLAAGARSPRVAGLPLDVAPPVRPVKGQIVRLRSVSAPIVRHVIRGIDGYLVARLDGELVCGATMEEQGYDTAVTAGAVYEILRNARELIPDVSEMELVEVATGLRPATPDNAPCIGATAIDLLLLATGHHRNGILLAPITADIITALLRDESPPLDVQPFAPRRFAAMARVMA